MAEPFRISSYPAWHQWPREGGARRLGEAIRRRHRQWEDGKRYSKREVDGFCWSTSERVRTRWHELEDGAVFRCSVEGAVAVFVLEPVDEDPLVDGGPAQAAIDQLRRAGWSLRAIAQRADISYDSAGRIAATGRRVRASTQERLLELVNGKP